MRCNAPAFKRHAFIIVSKSFGARWAMVIQVRRGLQSVTLSGSIIGGSQSVTLSGSIIGGSQSATLSGSIIGARKVWPCPVR